MRANPSSRAAMEEAAMPVGGVMDTEKRASDPAANSTTFP